MVDVTYQMVLSTIQTVGILVGIIYYLTIMRNTQKTRELALKAQEQALETRQAQLFMQWYNRFAASTMDVNSLDVFRDSHFENAEEWMNLMDTDEKFNKTMRSHGMFFEGIGVIVKEGLLNVRWIALMWGGATTKFWAKIEPVIEELREYYEYPRMWSETEYVCKEVINYMRKHPALAT